MARQYPYLSGKEKKKNITCETCHQVKDGFILEWQVSWFRGEDEYEKICNDCLVARDKKEKLEREAYEKKMRPIWEAKARKEANFWADMKRRLEEKYTVEYLTEYQWRINGVVDIYPTNRKWHDIKKNKRGEYRDMHGFLAKYL